MMEMNSTSDFNCTAYQSPSRVSTISASIVMTVFLIMGIFGNAWILWILIRSRWLRKNLINDLIISLCTNDLINLTLVQTFVVVSYYCNKWVTGSITCHIVPEANMILVGTSLWHHAFIAFHRYLVVVRWNFYLQIRKKVYLLVVILGSRVFPLILSFVFNGISYRKYRALPAENTNEPKSILQSIESYSESIFFYSPYLLRCVYKSDEKDRIICVLFLTVILPCIIVAICFTAIFIFIRKNHINVKKHMKNQNGAQIEIRISSYPSNPEQICSEPPIMDSDDFSKSCEITNATPESEQDSTCQTSKMYIRSADPVPGWTKFTEKKRKRLHSTLNLDKKRLSREMSITKMFGVVFLLFLAGYLPYGVTRMIDRTNIDPEKCSFKSFINSSSGDILRRSRGTPPELYVFISLLYAVASCCNPIIFGAMHSDVRKNATKGLKNMKRASVN